MNSETGRPHSKKPLSRTRAKAQMRALYANVPDARKAAAEETAGGVSRKPMTPAERARHASLVRWGKEQPFAARLEGLRQRRKAAKQKKAGGGKKPKAAKPTPEQRAAEQDKAAEEARAKVFSEMGIPEDAAGALSDLMAGVDTPDDGGLVKLGLAELGKDGTLRLTSAGRALHRAATRGDLGAAKDAASRGRDKVATQAERETEKQAREQEKAEKEKSKSGGGGGKKEKKKEKAAEPSEEEGPATDEEVAAETAAEVGIEEEELSFLRGAADGDLPPGSFDASRLTALGLVEDDGDETVATAEGVEALDALESGNVRRYRAAVRRGKARMRREARQKTREQEREKARKEKEEGSLRERARRTQEGDMRRQEQERKRDERSKASQDKRVAAEVERIDRARARKAAEVKHGAHDQSSHGRRGARGRGASAAYRGARAAGATAQEARAAANDVSQIHANQQRIANIDRQLQGEISGRQETSLQAERDRLVADNSRRAARVHPGATEQANEAYNANPAPTVRGRAGALHDYDQRLSVSRARRDETRGSLEQARRELEYRERAFASAQNAGTSIRRQYEKERNEARRDVARLEKQLKGYERDVARNRGLYEGELARPAFRQRRSEIYAQRERLRAYNPDYGKSLETDTMSDLTPIIEDLTTLLDEAYEVTEDTTSSTKAGKRNAGADQALIDQGYALAEELCGLFEQLGATVEEEEYEEGGEVEMLEGKAETIYGSEVKALDGDAIGGYAVLFGAEDTPDMSPHQDFFTKSTDYWLDRFGWPRPMTYHHAMDEDTRDEPIVGVWNKAVVKDEGIWLEGQLDRAHRYHGAIKELIKRGFLKLSSDSAPQWVVRERKPSGAHEVKRWPLLTASPTVTPAEPRMLGLSFKALMTELGLDDIDNPEVADTQEARPDAVKASQDERSRRLLLRSRLLALQE